MDASVDIDLTFKAIKHLLDISEALNRVQRLHTYSAIKTLCDALESTNKDDAVWAGDGSCLISELLCEYGSFVGIRPPGNIDPLTLAQTALSSLQSVYFSKKERVS